MIRVRGTDDGCAPCNLTYPMNCLRSSDTTHKPQHERAEKISRTNKSTIPRTFAFEFINKNMDIDPKQCTTAP